MNSSLKSVVWRTCVTAAIIILIASGFYAEENARGLRAWKDLEHEITARGESLNWDDYIPPPVPDRQNFYQAPMMAQWFTRSPYGGPNVFDKLVANPDNDNNFITEVSASNYLAWCETFAPEFSRIREALKRPAARLNGDYTKPFQAPLPNFVHYRTAAHVLAHQAKCHLLLGEPEQALNDLTLLHGLNLTLVKTDKTPALVTAMMLRPSPGFTPTRLPADSMPMLGASRNWPPFKSSLRKSTCCQSWVVRFKPSEPGSATCWT